MYNYDDNNNLILFRDKRQVPIESLRITWSGFLAQEKNNKQIRPEILQNTIRITRGCKTLILQKNTIYSEPWAKRCVRKGRRLQ